LAGVVLGKCLTEHRSRVVTCVVQAHVVAEEVTASKRRQADVERGRSDAYSPQLASLALDLPDNVTTSARGTLVLCEDSDQDNYLRGLSRGGQLWDIALNRLTSSAGVPRFNDEFAGSTFSPDGHTLFVNIQASRGVSFAIWGPWARIGV
jgi:secreted PhoX family phosphatase